MIALIHKELLGLRPFVFVLIALVGFNYIPTLFTDYPDEQHFSKVLAGPVGIVYALNFIVCFSIALGLLVREKTGETLEFLDSLPVSRTAVFFAKYIAALLLLVLLSVVTSGLTFLLHLISRTSLEPELYFGAIFKLTVVECWLYAIYLAVALLLSYLRLFGLIVLGVYLLAIQILGFYEFPGVRLIDPLAAGDEEIVGNTVVIPWRILGPQSIIAAVCLFLAWMSFLRLGKTPPKDNPALRWVGWIGLVAGAVALFVGWSVWTAVTMQEMLDEEGVVLDADGSEQPQFPGRELSKARTETMAFTYPTALKDRADALIGDAERVHARVCEVFDTEPVRGLRIDLTSTSPRHAGVAFWKKVNMNLGYGESDAERSAVLGHELTHIYINELSDNLAHDQFMATRFFHEGTASHLEYAEFREDGALDEIRKNAVAAHEVLNIKFDDLIDSARLSEKYAAELVYPLGEVFAAAIVESYGEGALGEIIRAFGRDDAPKNLAPAAFWADTFQSCGYDLEVAIAAYYGLIESESEKHADFLEGLPELRAEIRRPGASHVVIRLNPGTDAQSSEMGEFSVRVRESSDTPEHLYRYRRANRKGEVRFPVADLPSSGFGYQVGHDPGGTMMSVFGPWVQTPMPEVDPEAEKYSGDRKGNREPATDPFGE